MPSSTKRWQASVGSSGIVYGDPAGFARMLFELKGKQVYVTVEEQKEIRRLGQNSLLWAVYRKIAKESEADEDQIHILMKGTFLPLVEVKMPSGKTYKTVGSTTGLSVREMSEYIDKVIREAAENGIYVDLGGME